MALSPQEWLKQSDYDMGTAQAMFDAERFLYAAFMCHLALEKALKGLFQARLAEMPPKTHSLVYLLKRVGITPPEPCWTFIARLNEASITTRYPEDLDTLQARYPESVTAEILRNTREALAWIRTQL